MTDDARIDAVAEAIGFFGVDIQDAMSPRQLVDAFDVLIRAHDAAQSPAVRTADTTAAPPLTELQIIEGCARAGYESDGSNWVVAPGHIRIAYRGYARAVLARYRELAPAGIDRERARAALIYLAEWAGLSIRGAIEVLGEDGYPDIAALLDERTEKGGER
jgi:hypothetical protein